MLLSSSAGGAAATQQQQQQQQQRVCKAFALCHDASPGAAFTSIALFGALEAPLEARGLAPVNDYVEIVGSPGSGGGGAVAAALSGGGGKCRCDSPFEVRLTLPAGGSSGAAEAVAGFVASARLQEALGGAACAGPLVDAPCGAEVEAAPAGRVDSSRRRLL